MVRFFVYIVLLAVLGLANAARVARSPQIGFSQANAQAGAFGGGFNRFGPPPPPPGYGVPGFGPRAFGPSFGPRAFEPGYGPGGRGPGFGPGGPGFGRGPGFGHGPALGGGSLSISKSVSISAGRGGASQASSNANSFGK